MRHRYAQFIPEMQSYLILDMSMDVLYHINGLVEVIYMLISRDAEKSFDKIQHPLITKTLAKKQLWIEENLPSLINIIYPKLA